MSKDKPKKPKRFIKFLLWLVCILAFICIVWTAFSLIGRISPDLLIPESAVLRINIAHPVRLLDGILSYESLQKIAALPQLKPLEESSLYKNRLLRLAARGSLEIALLQTSGLQTGGSPNTHGTQSVPGGQLALAWDMGMCSPLLRILPLLSGFANVPNLYYVQAGNNSRFEYRMEDRTLFIGPFRNVLFITDSPVIFESRSSFVQANKGKEKPFSIIKPSSVDAAMLLSPDFLGSLLAEQDAGIAAIMENIEFGSAVEAGLSVYPKKLELQLAAPVSSPNAALSRLLEQRSSAPVMAERLPAAAQYATILSAGTLDELYQAALVFSGPVLEDSLKRADSSSRLILGLSLQDLLFSWSGNEFAIFGMEGRPHPVYAIHIANERKRQEVFDKAFRSIALNEDVRLSLDGTRIPRIAIPDFLQSLLRQWNIFLPSPYYIIHKDYLMVSESAETLLAAMRAIQTNDVLPRTAAWRTIAGGKAASSAFSLYYSLDLSMPFFLRHNTALSNFFAMYRQGLLRMNFDKGMVDLSLALVPGSGGGVTLMSGYPLDIGRGNLSNHVYGAGRGGDRRIFLSAGNSVISINTSDNSISEFSGQGPVWVIPADSAGRSAVNVWVVSTNGRVTLVDGSMEPEQKFPVITGLRLSSLPAVWNGKLYLCDEDGKVHSIDTNGVQETWETSFFVPLRSPPSFLSITTGRSTRAYAAVYPKSFFGEIWLLDADGKVLTGWPADLTSGLEQENFSGSSGIGFGSPLLFARNNRVHIAFVSQAGELFVFDENAAFVQPFPLILDGVFYQQPVFDGEFLWLISSNGTLFRLSLEGEILYQRIPGFSVEEEGFLTVFDCDGDTIPEIFITGEGNALHGYTRHFRSLEGFPLPVWGRPLFVSGSGKPEITGLGMDRRLYRWQFK
ncbi:MAG: hypothetical protein LBH97_02545 [Treponema sp.]|nr:hypothetical protein [Treponema sp.]